MDRFEIAWTPDPKRINGSNTARFMNLHAIETYAGLVERSAAEPEWFWEAAVEFLGIPFGSEWRAIRDTSRGHQWATWFIDARFNLSVAAVDRWADEDSSRSALKSLKESGEMRELSFGELRDEVETAAGALTENGVRRGDAVAVYLPMGREAVVSLLAVARIGAVFVPIFSGYGAEAVAARLDDPRPKALICANRFRRGGSPIDMKEMADEAVAKAGGIDLMIVVDYDSRPDTPMSEGRDIWWHDALSAAAPTGPADTYSENPLLIAYTSGATGRPKGAVHVQAGLTAKVAAEGAFQLEIGTDDTVMWVTDMGWIMGPWMVIAGLVNGAAVATFDGAPGYPEPGRLWEVVEQLQVTILGISPTLIRALQPHGAEQAHQHDLASLKVFGSTGEPWDPDSWWWLFRGVGEERIPIINISGGAEIGACLLSANILQGLKPTSLGMPALGIDADVFNDEGMRIRGEVGELVVRGSWPGMTRGFWNEPERYLDTYWSRFDDTWVHGDWASVDDDGFWYLHGRSDDTLNIAGKRIGPAEVESVAAAMPEVTMAAAIGVPDDVKGEVIEMYLVAAPGVTPDEQLSADVMSRCDTALGKAFRPRRINWVGDLPRTQSQKIMRRIVKAIALGSEPGDLSSLENPESLAGLRQPG